MSHIVRRQTKTLGVRYQAAYRDPSGRERTKQFSRKRDAEEFLAQMAVDVSGQRWVDPLGGRKLFKDWVEEWEKTKIDLRPSSRTAIHSMVYARIVPVFGDQMIGKIKQPHVQGWIASLSQRFSPAYSRSVYSRLKEIFAAAVDAELLKSSPCHHIRLPRDEPVEMRFLTAQEVGELHDAMAPKYKALVLLGCLGGLRIGEMAGLKRDKIDLLRGTVAVDCTAYQGRIGPPKTRASRRVVPITRQVVQALDEHCRGLEADDFVFPGAEGPMRPSHWSRDYWKPAIKRAGLEPLRPHDMRHTAVALWIASGMDSKEVSARAGHTSVRFTLDRYGHLFPSQQEAATERLADLFDSSSPRQVREIVRFPPSPTESGRDQIAGQSR